MFGMLDYRAFQLYRLLFFIPNFILVWITNIGYPFATYALAYYLYAEYFALEPMIYLMWLFAIIGFFIVGIPFSIVNWIFVKLFDFVFNVLIDVVPGDGRTEDEANFVLKSGKGGVNQLLMDKINPKEWDDEMISKSIRYSDWIARLLYSNKIYLRLNAVRDHYLYNADENLPVTMSEVTAVIEREGLAKSWSEEVLSNHYFRQMLIQISIGLVFLVTNPFAG